MAQKLSGLGMDDTGVVILRLRDACPLCPDQLARTLSNALYCVVPPGVPSRMLIVG
jgi:hypothetical protein